MIARVCALRVLFAVAIASVVVAFANNVTLRPARERMMIVIAEHRRVPSDNTTGARPTGVEPAIIDASRCRAFQDARTLRIAAVEVNRSISSVAHELGNRRGARHRHACEHNRECESRSDLSSSYPLNYPQPRRALGSDPRFDTRIWT